jgi:hypothetical protein
MITLPYDKKHPVLCGLITGYLIFDILYFLYRVVIKIIN